MAGRLLTAAALALALACAHRAPADEAAAPPTETDRVDGTVVIQPDADADRYLSSGYAGPFPDRGTMLALAVGQLARQDAVDAFGAWFRGGARIEVPGASRSGVRVVVTPIALNEAAPGLQPAISLRLQVAVLGANGRPAWEETFSGGSWSGALWFRPGLGYPELNDRLQAAVRQLVERAAAEAAARARSAAHPAA